MKDVSVTLNGAFSVVDRHGVDLTPRGNRARALLAILLLSEDQIIGRAELRKLLWGSKDDASAKVSLRQTLAEIRKALRQSSTNAADAIDTNHSRAWLNDQFIEIDPLNVQSSDAPFLSNISVPGPNYKRWYSEQLALRRQRDPLLADGEPGNPAHRRTLWLLSEVEPRDGLTAIELQRQLQLTVSDQTPVQCVELHDNSDIIRKKGDLLFQVLPFTQSEPPSLSLSLKSAGARDILWRSTLPTHTTGRHHETSRVSFYTAAQTASDNAITALQNARDSSNINVTADALVGRALKRLLSFVPAKIIESKLLLEQAQRIRPHPMQLAWLCKAILFQTIELPHRPSATNITDHTRFADEALSIAPNNATVLAFLSQTSLLLMNSPDAARVMAEEALRINPGLAAAHIANAVIDCHDGCGERAIDHAHRALTFGENSPLIHVWHMTLALAYIRHGEFDHALSSALKAHLGAPAYKVPMRYLYALYLHHGQQQQAANMLSMLHRVEPQFSLQHVRETPHFPAREMRESPLIDGLDVPPLTA